MRVARIRPAAIAACSSASVVSARSGRSKGTSQKTTVEPFVQQLEQRLAAVQSVCTPSLRRCIPFRSSSLVGGAGVASFRRLAPSAESTSPRSPRRERLPRPFDHDQRSVVSQSRRQSVDHRGGIGCVMKRCRGDHGVDSLRKLEVLELDAVVVGGVGAQFFFFFTAPVAWYPFEWRNGTKPPSVTAAEIEHARPAAQADGRERATGAWRASVRRASSPDPRVTRRRACSDRGDSLAILVAHRLMFNDSSDGH